MACKPTLSQPCLSREFLDKNAGSGFSESLKLSPKGSLFPNDKLIYLRISQTCIRMSKFLVKKPVAPACQSFSVTDHDTETPVILFVYMYTCTHPAIDVDITVM